VFKELCRMVWFSSMHILLSNIQVQIVQLLAIYRIYSRISRKINDKIMPQKLGGGDLSPGLY